MENLQTAEKRKTIGISVPCFNEEENIVPLTEAIIKTMQEDLPQYDYIIQFIDNDSQDNTRLLIRQMCEKYPQNVRAIFNAKNFGGISGYHGLMNVKGDCCIPLAADFQCPVELIPQLVREWEKGYKIVCAIKNKSKVHFALKFVRQVYYKIITSFSSTKQIPNFTGFGAYDRHFLEVCRNLKDPVPNFRGIVAEIGYNITSIYFTEPKRKHGKSKQNFFSLFDLAMRNITNYTSVIPRVATFGGLLFGGASVLVALVYLVLKLLNWDNFDAGIAPVVLGVFFIGGLQLMFLGLMGEYLLNINRRILNRPLVVEEERINFESSEESIL